MDEPRCEKLLKNIFQTSNNRYTKSLEQNPSVRELRAKLQSPVENHYSGFNYLIEHKCALPAYEDEKCIVQIECINGSFYHLTGRRIIHEDSQQFTELLNYSEIQKVYIIRSQRERTHGENPDSINVLTSKGNIKIKNLGICWSVLETFLKAMAPK